MTSPPISEALPTLPTDGKREAIAARLLPHGIYFPGEDAAPVCMKHRTELGHQGDMPFCQVCCDEAVQRQRERDDAARANEAQAGAAARLQRLLEERIGSSGIPLRYQGCEFDTFPGRSDAARRACSVLRSYANTWKQNRAEGISVLLLGGSGTGKTGLACAVGNRVMREFHGTVAFMSAYGAVRHMRDTWGRKGRTERQALDDLLGADLLILDEIGASVGTDYEMTALFEVINGRYAEKKPTFLLSNLPLDDYTSASAHRPGLRSFLGTRVIDRFNDDGSFTVVFNWPSLRGQARTETGA